METVLRILEEGPKVEIHLDALKVTLKKYQIGILPLVKMAYTDFGLKFTSIHNRLAAEMNKCINRWITKGETTLISEDPLKGTPK